MTILTAYRLVAQLACLFHRAFQVQRVALSVDATNGDVLVWCALSRDVARISHERMVTTRGPEVVASVMSRARHGATPGAIVVKPAAQSALRRLPPDTAASPAASASSVITRVIPCKPVALLKPVCFPAGAPPPTHPRAPARSSRPVAA